MKQGKPYSHGGGLTMWNTWIDLDFMFDVLGFQTFSAVLQDFIGEERIIF